MRRSTLPAELLGLATAALFALPVVWMLLSSLKPPGQPESEFWPATFYWQNYAEVIEDERLLVFLGNSLFYAVATSAGTTVSCCVVAYGFAKLEWPGRDALFLVLIATMLLPFHVTMLPRFQLFAALGLYGTYWPLILPNWLAQEAFSVFLLRQFFLTIPDEVCDAARIDGAGEWTILSRIVVPMSYPALATVAVLQFLATWNEFAGPLLYLNDPARYPLAYALQQFVSAYRTQFGPLMAGAVLFTLPAAILFMIAGRIFTRGIAAGGLKG
ncbi:carbohydrate ABC transporter permease [Stratiformator vulcanicus]|uniref:L-arabinose transport system permease protein AraQ n=1 Tax=Stratiformator vulcanicus TaxID=2527980 RepID=A0A517R4W8_9PLAN|nr:carbohydrate ABC transporter permease [Stratiformator vulcanicus]QDT38863.1 L-arabinose transport system permease protein AraQ [Stratiformator vulcanicus]